MTGGPWLTPAEDAAAAPRAVRVAAVVVNPTKVDDPQALRDVLDAALTAAGWGDVRWLWTTADDPGYGTARRAVEAGAGLVLVCGGDGTVRAVITEVAGRQVELGVVPLGTGNLLARNLGLPLDDVRAAVEIAVNGPLRALDVGRVEPEGARDRPERFAVMAGIGMDAAIMRDAPESAKSRIGWPAYVVSALRHLRGPGVAMHVQIDGAPPRRVFAKTVLVGNVGTLQGGLPVMPDAAPDDGLLDVAVLSPNSLRDWLWIAGRVLRDRLRHGGPGDGHRRDGGPGDGHRRDGGPGDGHRRDDRRYTCHRGTQVRVSTRTPHPRQADGDLIAAARSLRIEIEPGALAVHVPPPPTP